MFLQSAYPSLSFSPSRRKKMWLEQTAGHTLHTKASTAVSRQMLTPDSRVTHAWKVLYNTEKTKGVKPPSGLLLTLGSCFLSSLLQSVKTYKSKIKFDSVRVVVVLPGKYETNVLSYMQNGCLRPNEQNTKVQFLHCVGSNKSNCGCYHNLI